MGELVDGQPLFPGDSEIDQLYIVQVSVRLCAPICRAVHSAVSWVVRFSHKSSPLKKTKSVHSE